MATQELLRSWTAQTTTVHLQFSCNAICTHGLPEHIYNDLGGDIWRYMVEQHATMSAVIIE